MSNLKKKIAAAVAVGSLGAAGLAVAAAAPAGAMPKQEFKFYCVMSGGTFQSMGGWGVCSYADGTVIRNGPDVP